MVMSIILVVAYELFLLLHYFRPNFNYTSLLILQVRSLFDYYSIASTIIMSQSVAYSFKSEQHVFTNSCSCIPYSLSPLWPKY